MPDASIGQLCLIKNSLKKINGKGEGIGMLALCSPLDMNDLLRLMETSNEKKCKIYSSSILFCSVWNPSTSL